MKEDSNNNPVASYIEAQMSGTAGIVQAAMQGVQRVQEIMLRAMREGAGGQMALARSMSGARGAADISRVGEANAGPAAEQFTRYQQELMGAVTEMNTGMIQASYSMMERVGQALAASASAMGLPASGQTGGPMAAYQAGMRQWQGAMEQLTQGVRGLTSAEGEDEDEDEEEEEVEEEEVEEPQQRPSRKATAKRTRRR
ncbi:MAG: phasin family protein [Burkholderiaceae bacterium]